MTTLGVDPFERVSRKQAYRKKTSIKLAIRAEECVTVDELSQKRGSAYRLMFRPPLPFQKTASGKIHADSRGNFSKLESFKVVIKNKLNGDLRYKYTLPVGDIDDPTQIVTRPIVMDGNIKPTGSKKVKSRTKGSKKNKREVQYNSREDQVSFNVQMRSLFNGTDVNKYRLYEERVPGDSESSYFVFALGVGDFALILPNQNQQSGAPYAKDLIVAEVVLVVNFQTTEQGAGMIVDDEETVFDCYRGELNSLDALYHIDVAPLIPSAGLALSPGSRKQVSLPITDNPCVGVVWASNVAKLCYMNAKGAYVEDFRYPIYEHKDIRIVVHGLIVCQVDEARAIVAACEFGYNSRNKAWVIMNHEGDATTYSGGVRTDCVSARAAIDVYSIAKPTKARSGTIAHYGHVNARAITWASIAQGLTIAIKVLGYALRVASYFA